MRLLAALLFLTIITAGLMAKEKKPPVKKPPTIKVLLKKNTDGSLVEVKGPYKVYNPLNRKLLSIGFRGKRYFALPLSNGIKWGESFPGIFQIQITPTSNETSILIDGIEYRGGIEIYLFNDKIHIINEVDIENYVNSVLSNLFGFKKHPKQVIESLAIISRTNAYYTALNNLDSFWHITAEKEHYNGYATTMIDPDIEEAVYRTRHLVMTYKNEPFACSYTNNSAGKTASYSDIYRKNLACPVGIEASIAKKNREKFKWKFTKPIDEIGMLYGFRGLKGIDLFVDKDSARVYGIRLKSNMTNKDITFNDFQKAIGEQILKSNDFVVKIINDKVTFEGYGEGLGVGLCLYSAAQEAKDGKTAENILQEFFPLTFLQKIDSFESYISLIK